MLSLHPVFWGAKSNTEQAGLSNQQEWLKDQTSQGARVVFSGGRKQKKDFLIHYASIFLVPANLPSGTDYLRLSGKLLGYHSVRFSDEFSTNEFCLSLFNPAHVR